ncbi:LCP family protein [Streptomyces sp. NPDC046821]|uniref:LCP family protein n=1 Tax=Streptomyces sp. NPDC046821 TaxID=3154702 RepID=UPI0033F8092D
MSGLRDGSVDETKRGGTRARVPGQRTGGRGKQAGPRSGHRASGGGRSRRRAPKKGAKAGRRRRGLRIALICLSVLLVATAGAGWWFYQHLNGNIRSVALTDGAGGKEKPDAFGRTPINILVMGSDGRTSKADCKLGGGCAKTGVQSVGNADVELVVHVSADRSNATMMSIPRDTETDIPACTDPKTGASTPGYRGMINSALGHGPACQVAAVHQLTGIPIDHFVQLDFSGVVKMSDAVGGVDVCVSSNVYDTYSHLKLSKGSHTLKGVAALEFVRSRHGFGDGSDLGRTYAQHIFLSSMLRKFKSAGTLTDPTAVYGLADAATKALTVDTGLGSVKQLVGLAADMNKVPTDRTTFTTMQTVPAPDDANRLVPAEAAKALFATIADDQSLTTHGGGDKSKAPTASASATPSATPSSVPASEIAVTVANGTATSGRAAAVASALTADGFAPGTKAAGNAPHTTSTTLTYGSGQKAEALTVARALRLPASHLKQSGTGLTLVIGTDWPSGTAYPESSERPVPADTAQAAAGSHARTADNSGSCSKVSQYKTVEINGVPMTPAQAYAAATGQPDSDA